MAASGVAAANTIAAAEFVRALAAAGVQDVCITPGSRSTPLTIAFVEQTAIRPWLHLDERSSSYFALGLARAKRRPVALVCTSGTAAANYAPAVVEANLSRIPLIVCTADRPPRLRDAGASQTIDQLNMYGTNVRWALDLPAPYGLPGEAGLFRGFAERAVRAAMSPLPGPVQLNFPFDEPLTPPPSERPPVLPVEVPAEIACPAIEPSASDLEFAVAALRNARRPMIVAGPESWGLPADEIAWLAAALDAPILADPLSGLRNGAHDRSRVVDGYDAMVRTALPGAFAPDVVLRFGAAPTSKALGEYLAAQDRATHLLCELPGGWRDPGSVAGRVIVGDTALVASSLAAMISGAEPETGWCERWVGAGAAASGAMTSYARTCPGLSEGTVFTELAAALTPGTTLFAGNSMPVRDMDSFLNVTDLPLTVVSNRGAAGIDGVTSSALGAAAAGGPVVLVIGDISFYHDMNGLWAARRHALDLTIVLVNNNGGGIFHYLPQANHPAVFEEWFGTAPDLDFSHATAMYGGVHSVAEDWDQFRTAFSRAGKGLHVIELRTDRAANAQWHREAWALAAAALNEGVTGAH